MRHCSLVIVTILGLNEFSPAIWAGDKTFDATAKEAEGDGDLRRAVHVTSRVCQRVVRHRPSADVNYQPGVDVDGDPVVPADLPGHRIDLILPEAIAFDLPLDPFGYIGRTDLAEKFPNAQFSVGRIEYDVLAGRLTLNGQELGNDQEAALQAACVFYARNKP